MELFPGKGAHSGKLVTLTDEGRALAARTVEPVILAEQRAIVGVEAEMQQFYEIGQRHMERLRAKFEKL